MHGHLGGVLVKILFSASYAVNSTVSTEMSVQRCHRLHKLSPSPLTLQQQRCAVCSTKFMPNYQTLTCEPCAVSLCLECVLIYAPETAFAIHLARHFEPCTLQYYKDHRNSATQLLRDPFLAEVYHEYQRFYNTDAYIRILGGRIANLKQEIKCLKTEMQSAQSRLTTTELELLNAQQRRRYSAEANPPLEEEEEEEEDDELEVGLA